MFPFFLHRKYLRFLWNNIRYEFTCLPFGYSLAPRVFTKIFKPILASLRFKGIRLIISTDDILIIAESMTVCKQHLRMVRELLESLGFIINVNKSSLIPTTRFTFLGFELDSIPMKVFLPQGKVLKIIQACDQLRERHKVIKLREELELLGRFLIIQGSRLELVPRLEETIGEYEMAVVLCSLCTVDGSLYSN